MTDNIGGTTLEPRQVEVLKAFALAIDKVLNLDETSRKNGFALLVFPFDKRSEQCDYISNASHEDLVELFKEQLARFEENA